MDGKNPRQLASLKTHKHCNNRGDCLLVRATQQKLHHVDDWSLHPCRYNSAAVDGLLFAVDKAGECVRMLLEARGETRKGKGVSYL